MSDRSFHVAARSNLRILLCTLIVVALMGCATRTGTLRSPELVRSGWSEPSALTPSGDFSEYVSRVTGELRVHRLAFDAARADHELVRVAPFRMAPGAHCDKARPRGIVILIHGLSDTAFAMRDLAASFSRQCLEARVLLLPGHGTRAADLLHVDHTDWLAHVEASVAQASREHDRVVVAGFSLGAALAVAVAAKAPDRVDAVIGFSPAYRIRSSFWAQQARWVAAIRPWLDTGPREEFARYEAMPTRGVASTMALLREMDARVEGRGQLPMPWLVVQSEDDEVVDTLGNRRFFAAHAGNPRSALLNYFSGPAPARGDDRTIWMPAADSALRVAGLSHLAVHIAPHNDHYGTAGSFRNCGSFPFRPRDAIRACKEADRVWYGVGDQ